MKRVVMKPPASIWNKISSHACLFLSNSGQLRRVNPHEHIRLKLNPFSCLKVNSPTFLSFNPLFSCWLSMLHHKRESDTWLASDSINWLLKDEKSPKEQILDETTSKATCAPFWRELLIRSWTFSLTRYCHWYLWGMQLCQDLSFSPYLLLATYVSYNVSASLANITSCTRHQLE